MAPRVSVSVLVLLLLMSIITITAAAAATTNGIGSTIPRGGVGIHRLYESTATTTRPAHMHSNIPRSHPSSSSSLSLPPSLLHLLQVGRTGEAWVGAGFCRQRRLEEQAAGGGSSGSSSVVESLLHPSIPHAHCAVPLCLSITQHPPVPSPSSSLSTSSSGTAVNVTLASLATRRGYDEAEACPPGTPASQVLVVVADGDASSTSHSSSTAPMVSLLFLVDTTPTAFTTKATADDDAYATIEDTMLEALHTSIVPTGGSLEVLVLLMRRKHNSDNIKEEEEEEEDETTMQMGQESDVMFPSLRRVLGRLGGLRLHVQAVSVGSSSSAHADRDRSRHYGTYSRHDGLRGSHIGEMTYAEVVAAGLGASRGKYAVIIATSAQRRFRAGPGWLSALMYTMTDALPQAAVVGPLTLNRDLSVRDAGGTVLRDGTHLTRPFAVGGGARPPPRLLRGLPLPLWAARPVDFFADPGCLLVRRAAVLQAFERVPSSVRTELGAWSDVSLQLLKASHRVVIQPFSVVVVEETALASTGRGTTTARYRMHETVPTRHQDILSFMCPHACSRHGPTPAAAVDETLFSTLHRRRPHVLFMDASVPETALDAGSVRLMELLRLLRSDLDLDVTFEGARLRGSRYLVPVLAMGITVQPKHSFEKLLSHFSRLESQRRILHTGALCPYDVVILARVKTAAANLELIRRLCPHAPVIFDTVDVSYLREARLLDLDAPALRPEELDRRRKLVSATKATELEMMRKANATFIVSTFEREWLSGELPQEATAKLRILSNIYPPANSSPESKQAFRRRSGALFVGNMCHSPNVDAVRTIVRDILPRWDLRNANHHPFRMHFVLSNLKSCPLSDYDSLFGDVDYIQVHESMSNDALYDLHRRVRILLSPIRAGAGVKGKLNMALWLGLPIVATPLAAEGMHLEDGISAVIASTPEDIARAASTLYSDFKFWRRIRSGGFAVHSEHFSRELALRTLRDTLNSLNVNARHGQSSGPSALYQPHHHHKHMDAAGHVFPCRDLYMMTPSGGGGAVDCLDATHPLNPPVPDSFHFTKLKYT